MCTGSQKKYSNAENAITKHSLTLNVLILNAPDAMKFHIALYVLSKGTRVDKNANGLNIS